MLTFGAVEVYVRIRHCCKAEEVTVLNRTVDRSMKASRTGILSASVPTLGTLLRP